MQNSFDEERMENLLTEIDIISYHVIMKIEESKILKKNSKNLKFFVSI